MGIRLLPKIIRHINTKLDYVFNFGFSKPEIIYLQITDRCNLHCQNCDIWKNIDMPELDLCKWEDIIRELKKLRKDLSVIVSGGEPLLYKNFWQFLDLLKKYDVGISINTNGFVLNNDLVSKLLDRRLDRIEISIYSLKPEVNNKLRNTPQAFERAHAAICDLVKIKIF